MKKIGIIIIIIIMEYTEMKRMKLYRPRKSVALINSHIATARSFLRPLTMAIRF